MTDHRFRARMAISIGGAVIAAGGIVTGLSDQDAAEFLRDRLIEPVGDGLVAGGGDGTSLPREAQINRAIDTLARFCGCTIDDAWRALAPLHGPTGALSDAPPVEGGGGHPGLAAPSTPDTPELAGPQAPGAPAKGRKGGKSEG